ncbi:MAG: hypothetical protein ACI97A_001316 [Planctomycetota bacterium]
MTTTRHLVATLAVLLLTCVGLSAQKPKVAAPTAKSIIEKHLTAVGGKANLLKARSQNFKSKIVSTEGRMLEGEMEIYFARLRVKDAKTGEMVDRACFKFEMKLGGTHTVMASNGVIGWQEYTSADGAEYRALIDVKELPSHINMFDPAALARYDTYYKSCEMVRKAMISGKPAYEVKLVSKEDKVEHYFFDLKSGLLVAVKSFLNSPSGVQVSKTSFSDYRAIDGIKTSFSSLGEGTGFKQTVTLQAGGGYNRKIDAKIFAPSKEVLALVKKKKEPVPAKKKEGTKQQ